MSSDQTSLAAARAPAAEPIAGAGGYLRRAAQVAPELPLVRADGRVITYGEAWAAAQRLAGELVDKGLAPGERAFLCMPNHPIFPILCNAVWIAGGIVVAASPIDARPTLALKVADCAPRLIVTSGERELVLKLADASRAGMSMLAVGPLWEAVLDGTPDGAAPANDVAIPPADIAILQYTGGTTGTPKAAVLGHANILANIWQMQTAFPGLAFGEERFLAAAPFSHITGMATMMLALSLGAEIAIVTRFQASEVVKLIVDRRLTYVIGVPTMYNAMLQAGVGTREGWSSVKYALAGGAPIPTQLAADIAAATGLDLITGYGLSETSSAVAIVPPGTPAPYGATGHPLVGTSVEIRSIADPRAPAPPGEPGEICVAGPQVTRGYWQQPQATEAAFVDGLFRTGDIGFVDADGHLHIVDRLKDVIIASGFNVYPTVVEEAIYQHPDVVEAAAIGEPDGYRGETVKAVVALKPGASMTLAALQEFLKDRLSPIEMPKRLDVVDELPKSPAGKVLRRSLRTA